MLKAGPEKPVLVDFWAPWCAPCRQLKPLLERIAPEYGIDLVKVNTQELPNLAERYGVRGIPDVKLFKNGAPIDGFVGALGEAEIRSFLDRHAKSRLDGEIEALKTADTTQKSALINALLQNYPAHPKARLAAAEALIALERGEEARALLSAFRSIDAEYNRAQALLALIGFAAECKNPEDSQTGRLYAQACCHGAKGDYEAALRDFLAVTKADRGFKDDAGRKAMLALFNLLGNNHPLTRDYRSKLSAVLF